MANIITKSVDSMLGLFRPSIDNTQLSQQINEDIMQYTIKKPSIGLVTTELGSGALYSSRFFTDSLLDNNLIYPQSIRTYYTMCNDEAVSNCNNNIRNTVRDLFNNYEIISTSKNNISKNACNFINYCIKNMGMSLPEFTTTIIDFVWYGFSASEIVLRREKDTSSDFFGSYVLDKLSPRPALSLHTNVPFIIGDNGRDVIAMQQSGISMMNSPFTKASSNSKALIQIPRIKFLRFSFSSEQNDPMGDSVLKGLYSQVYQKATLERYETISVTKNITGTPVIGTPLEYFLKAGQDSCSPEALTMDSLKKQIAAMHAGDLTGIIMPIDVLDNSNTKGFSFDIKGISGQVISLPVGDMIKRRRKIIYDHYMSSHLLSGEDGGKGDVLHKKQQFDKFIDTIANVICEQINTHLIPLLLRVNNFNLKDNEIPYLKIVKDTTSDLATFSSAVQRISSVGFLPKTPDIIKSIVKAMGLDVDIPDDITEEEWKEWMELYLPEKTSRSGDGMATAGNGTSNSVSSIDTSINNLENS